MSWQQLYPIAPPVSEVRRDWTKAILGNEIYFFQAGHEFILRLDTSVPDAPEVVPFKPTFLTEALENGSIMGIFEARGRLGVWDVAGAVYWSALGDREDFTPSLSTGSNVVTVDALRGRLTVIIGTSDGFMVYGSSNIVKGTYQQGQVNPFRFDEFDPSLGIFSKDHVTVGKSGEHYVWSQGALYRINAGTIVGQHSIQVAHVELADFIKLHKGYPKLSFHTNRYLVLQVSERDYVEGESIFWRDRNPGNEYFYPAISDQIDFPGYPGGMLEPPPGQFVAPDPPGDCSQPAPDDTPYFWEPGPQPLESTPLPPENPDYWNLWAMNMRRTVVPEVALSVSPTGTYIETTSNNLFALVFENARFTDFRITDESAADILANHISGVSYTATDRVNYTLRRSSSIPTLSWEPMPLMAHQFRLWIAETREWQAVADNWPSQQPETFVGKLYRILSAPTMISKVAAGTSIPAYLASSWDRSTGELVNVVARNGFIETWRAVLALEPYEESVPTGNSPAFPTDTTIQDYNDAEGSARVEDLYISLLRSEQTFGNHYVFRYFPDEGLFNYMQGCHVRSAFNGYPLPGFKMPGRTHIRLAGLTDNQTYATIGVWPHFTQWLSHGRHAVWLRKSVLNRTEGGQDIYNHQITYTYQWEPVEGSGFDSLNNSPNGYLDLGYGTVPKLDANSAWRVFKFLKSAQPRDPRPLLREFYRLALAANPTNPLTALRQIYEANGFIVESVTNVPVTLRDMTEEDWDDGNVRFNSEPDQHGTTEEAVYYDTVCEQPLAPIVDPEGSVGIPIIVTPTPGPASIEFNLDDWLIQSPEIVTLQGNSGAGPYYPRYVRAFVFDTHLQKWGSCDVVHTVFADVAPVNAVAHDPMTDVTTSHFTYDNYLSKLCCVLENGLVAFFDRNTFKSWLVLGKIGRRRRSLSRMLEIRFEFAEIPDCFTSFEPVDITNSKIVRPELIRLSKPTRGVTTMLVDTVTPHCYLSVVGGRYELIAITAGLFPAGER